MEAFIENDEIRNQVTHLLLEDLTHLGISEAVGYSIDWTDAVGEGGGTTYHNKFIESASNVAVRNRAGKLLCTGWVDHIVDAGGNLHSYWTSVRPANAEFSMSISEGFGIPSRVWETLNEQDKYHLAATYQGWSQDGNMRSYRRAIVPKQVEDYSKKVEAIVDNIDSVSIPAGFDLALYKKEARHLLKLSRKFLSGEKLDPTISTNTYVLQQQLWDVEASNTQSHMEDAQKIFNVLAGLEHAIRHAAIAIEKL